MLLIGAALAVHAQFADASHLGGMDAMSIDMDPTGNTATSLGPRDECIEVSAGDTVVFDVTAEGIPESNPLFGFSYALLYPVGQMVIENAGHEFLLAALQGSSLIDASDLTPDSDGGFTAGAIDIGGPPAPYETGSGVLSRLTLIVSETAGPGVYGLWLGEAAHIDPAAEAREPDALNNGYIAVDASCDDDRPTPTPSPIPLPTPTPTPTPMPPPTPRGDITVGIDHDAAQVDVNSGPLVVEPGASASAFISAENRSGIALVAWEIDVEWDPAVIDVTGCQEQPVGLNLCSVGLIGPNVVRSIGASASGISGSIRFAEVTFRGVGPPGACGVLTVQANQFASDASLELYPTVMHGQVCIGSPTPVPTPASTPLPSPTGTPNPAPAPGGGGLGLEIEVEIDRKGVADRDEDVVTISGTVKCSREATAGLSGKLKRRLGWKVVKVPFAVEGIECDGETEWSVEIDVPGKAARPGQAHVKVTAVGVAGGASDEDDAWRRVTLSPPESEPKPENCHKKWWRRHGCRH